MARLNEGALTRPVTVRDAAKMLGVPMTEVWRRVRRGELLTITSRRERLIPVCEMRAAME